MRRGQRIGVSLALITLLAAVPALAQSERRERVELAAGVGIFGPMPFDAVNATQAAPGGTRRVLFVTESALGASAGVAVRAGVPLTRVVSVESTLSLNQTRLSTTVTGDVERAPTVTASEPVTQYLVEAGVLFRPMAWRTPRLEPFITAGAGYLRQLNEGLTLVETGQSWYGGAGTHYWFRRRVTGRIRSSGLRFDLRVSVLDRGVALDDGPHVVPAGGVSVFVRF